MNNTKDKKLEERLAKLRPKPVEEKPKKEEDVNLTLRYVGPHKKVSRLVSDSDLKFVMEEAHIMFNLLHIPYKKCMGGFALAHQQINDSDPLRFFVTFDKKIIINPLITRTTRHTVDSNEGCLTFADFPPKIVQRYNKCEVEYYTLVGVGDLSEKKEISLSGMDAKVWQHECDHLECVYIWTEEEIKKFNSKNKSNETKI